MADCCEGNLNVEALEAEQRRVLLCVMLINFITFFGMITASWLSHSSALLSGTLDNLGDALTYALSLMVISATSLAKARVALFKGVLIGLAALMVAVQIIWRFQNPEVPVVQTMTIAAILNLFANSFCLWMLSRHRHDDVNMNSVYECSRNDVFEGLAVILTAALVWKFDSYWPDLIVAIMLLLMFSRSALRVVSAALNELDYVRLSQQRS